MAKFGWRPVFIGIGLVSLLWLPAWKKWMPQGGGVSTNAMGAGPGYMNIFKQRSFWGTSAGQFCCNYLLYFMLTWLPTYLVLERHLSVAAMARVAGLYYLVDAASAISTGWLQDFWIRRGYTPTLVRKSAMAIAFVISAIGITGCALAGANTYVAWLMAAGVGCGMTSPGIFAFCQRLAGPPPGSGTARKTVSRTSPALWHRRSLDLSWNELEILWRHSASRPDCASQAGWLGCFGWGALSR
jgi:cyanate permease